MSRTDDFELDDSMLDAFRVSVDIGAGAAAAVACLNLRPIAFCIS